MELILQGWLGLDADSEIGIFKTKRRKACDYESISELIMDHFNYEQTDEGLGTKKTFIPNANLKCWFSDTRCTLEEAMMDFESYLATGDLLTKGHYTGYSEWTITGFEVDCLTIGGHDLRQELKQHDGQYMHMILSD